MAVIALALLAITCPSVHAALLTFTLYNTSASQASTVCKRVGVAFEPGDIPSGYQVGVRVQGGADVYGALLNVKKYPDGSLWAGTLAVHDTNDIPAGGSRTYEVYSKAGNPPTSSWDSWSWITSNANDFTVDLTAHSGASSGSLPNRTYSLKTAIGTTTRREVSDNTQVLKRIYVWQKVSGEEHLICLFYVDFWLNTGGTAPIAVEYTPVMSQHWWKANPFGTVQTKEARTYNAAVKYGSTSLDSRTGLAHAYHCRWASLRSASDDQHACRHWIDLGNDPMPTLRLEYLSDAKSKLIKSGVIPPYNVLDNSTLALTSTYTPLGLNGHRAGITPPAHTTHAVCWADLTVSPGSNRPRSAGGRPA